MSLTRAEGYELGAPKEQAAIDVALDFFNWVGVVGETIDDPERNFRRGDLCFPSGRTVEVKGQPIDPARYRNNFVEVMEDTTIFHRKHHLDGFERTASMLGLHPDQLAAVDVRQAGTQLHKLGRLEYASASLTSVRGSFATVYVNPEPDAWHLYLYSSRVLLAAVKTAIQDTGLYRGRGKSNELSLCCFVPVPNARWSRSTGWDFGGKGDPSKIFDALRRNLTRR